MAKGQKRSSREAKKPKQTKSMPPSVKASGGGATSMQQLISSMTRGSKTASKDK
jgi:hypothetical protein